MKPKAKLQTSKEFSAAVGRALRRAAKVVRKTARMHGTPIYIWERQSRCRETISISLRVLQQTRISEGAAYGSSQG